MHDSINLSNKNDPEINVGCCLHFFSVEVEDISPKQGFCCTVVQVTKTEFEVEIDIFLIILLNSGIIVRLTRGQYE